jgi:hypothetical protein
VSFSVSVAVSVCVCLSLCVCGVDGSVGGAAGVVRHSCAGTESIVAELNSALVEP